jgi:hypothetical protein
MKIAVLGAAWFVGRTAAQALSARPEIRELLLVDYNIRDAKRFAKALSPKCRWAMADAGRAPELARLLDGVDAVANAVGPCSEYEKRILLTCADKGVPAASVGDGTLSDADLREIHDAFRGKGAVCVSGCGMMPGWTEILSAHFLTVGRTESVERGDRPRRYLFCSLDRFGGYAFFRRAARIPGPETTAPPGARPGSFFAAGEDFFGIPPGRPSGLYRRLGRRLATLGPVGMELSAAFLFWLRGYMKASEGTPASAAGVWTVKDDGTACAAIEDPRGRIAGVLLAEASLRLAAGVKGEKGLLPLHRLIGREEAERIAGEGGGKITTS